MLNVELQRYSTNCLISENRLMHFFACIYIYCFPISIICLVFLAVISWLSELMFFYNVMSANKWNDDSVVN